ncbi:MAG: type II toxin-antitoxin system RelE/ParE family toxin [Acidobacteria bacterium]|nr:type II toxin-antitoxin system RelE/ParE family toxin [Acidobacteriota bacterium]
MKDAIFHPAAIAAVRSFPDAVRREFGKLLFDLQSGETLGMPMSRPMPSVGKGVHELRLRDRSGIYRAFYFTRDLRGILIFHAFVKKSQSTPAHDLEMGRRRLKEMLNEEI